MAKKNGKKVTRLNGSRKLPNRGHKKTDHGSYFDRQECVEWTADRSARRVPEFVENEYGLDKDAIVAKYGLGALFYKTRDGRKVGARLVHRGKVLRVA